MCHSPQVVLLDIAKAYPNKPHPLMWKVLHTVGLRMKKQLFLLCRWAVGRNTPTNKNGALHHQVVSTSHRGMAVLTHNDIELRPPSPICKRTSSAKPHRIRRVVQLHFAGSGQSE